MDAIGDNQKVGEIETQLKDNLSTEITEDINVEVENAFRMESNYRKDPDSFNKIKDVINKKIEPKGNYFEVKEADIDADTIINFFFALSARFRKRNTVYQKGYIFDTSKGRDAEDAWEQVETNTPTYKRMGIVMDDLLVNRMAVNKLSQAFNVKYIDFKERFAYVKETTFGNSLKNDMTEDKTKSLLA